jgi:DNA-binding transcriptional LysR family regulator
MRPTSLNARHFEIFLTLITSQGLAEAAQKLSISQPAISKTIRLLERETGVPLFVRVNGRLQATRQAHQLLPSVQRAIGQLDAAKRTAYGLAGTAGELVLACGAPALASLVPVAVQRLRRAHPQIHLDIRAETTPNVITLVSNHEAEIGISTTAEQSVDARIVQKCEVRPICEHALVAVLPETHRLASRSTIRAVDLRDETIIALPDGSPTTVLVQATFEEANIAAHPPITVGNSVGVCSLVRQGVGIGLINPLQLAQAMFPGIVARPFRPRILLRTCLYFSTFQPLSPLATEMATYLEAAAKQFK